MVGLHTEKFLWSNKLARDFSRFAYFAGVCILHLYMLHYGEISWTYDSIMLIWKMLLKFSSATWSVWATVGTSSGIERTKPITAVFSWMLLWYFWLHHDAFRSIQGPLFKAIRMVANPPIMPWNVSFFLLQNRGQSFTYIPTPLHAILDFFLLILVWPSLFPTSHASFLWLIVCRFIDVQREFLLPLLVLSSRSLRKQTNSL